MLINLHMVFFLKLNSSPATQNLCGLTLGKEKVSLKVSKSLCKRKSSFLNTITIYWEQTLQRPNNSFKKSVYGTKHNTDLIWPTNMSVSPLSLSKCSPPHLYLPKTALTGSNHGDQSKRGSLSDRLDWKTCISPQKRKGLEVTAWLRFVPLEKT